MFGGIYPFRRYMYVLDEVKACGQVYCRDSFS